MAAFLLHRPRRHDMNQMEIFKNPEFGSIRTFEQDGKVLFCGKDVAQALGYRRPADAIAAHCKGVCVLPTPSNGGIQQMKFIPEGDVYRLIVHSKLPSAERFERWVFDEVLPSIRQHGAYLTREKLWEVATSPEALLKLCSDLLAEREKNAALQADNARLQGKAVYYDLFIDLRHSTNLRTTAKELEVPERRFVRFLLERRYVYRAPSGCVMPYAKSANDGLFCVKDFCRKTRETYVAYRKAGYSKKFRQEHEEEILLHQAAKEAFNELNVKKLPTIKELQTEYAQLLADKKKAYGEYRQARAAMRELLTVKNNVDRVLAMEQTEPQQKEKDHGQR